MKKPSAVCLACRFKLLASHQAALGPPWQPSRRRFGTSTAKTAAVAPAPTPIDPIDLPARSSTDNTKPKWPLKPGARSPKREKRASGAMALFRTVVDRKDAGSSGHVPAKDASSVTLELWEAVATLEEMLASSPSVSTAACFQYFNTHIYDRIRRQHIRVPRILRDRVGKTLMARVSAEKAKDFVSKDFPSVTLISQIFLELGLFEPASWAALTTQLLEHICSVSASPQDYTTIESYETAMARRDTLLHDLVGAWRMFNVPPYVAARTADGARAAADARLPSLDRRKLAENIRKGKPHLSVASLFPHYQPRQLQTTIPAAIATYVLLVDPINRTNRLFRQEITPFVDAMGATLYHNRPKRAELETLFGSTPAMLKYITERWSAVETQLDEQTKFEDILAVSEDGQPGQQNQYMKRIHRQLGQAWNTKNIKVLNRTWEEFWGPDATPSEAKSRQCRKHPDLFNYFIMAYMGMRQPSRAIEIWNTMVSIGVQPTVKTWSSMMDGCKRAVNLPGLKNVWTKLIASKMQLDTTIWTARISGLIELGDPGGGIAALEEMAQIWKANEKKAKKDPAAVKPTIQPVNAALAGLLRVQMLSSGAAGGLLSWAAKQGIEPDIWTFNTLLRPLLKLGRDDEVQNMLAMMKKQNLEADVATFTILLEGALEDLGDQSPQQQVETVHTFLRNMREAGVTANMQLYAKMIFLLLQQGDRAEEPVKAVLAHIYGEGLELTSHIYTMLAEHYFTRSPPDAAAVTALIENRRLHENRDIDRVFWERVIFGYCQVNDVGRALRIFDKIERSGSKITFSTLYELLLVLGRSGEREAVVRVVDFARRAKDLADEEAVGGKQGLGRSWLHRFWHLAEQYGAL